ncbi:spindle and kinetochore-associated protein 1-like [Actinia tenebrosa]|uniref:SKA complex subunit 1 n=1 Tax=Actinia tenebrosa TaxID=6105 RepID=A0A6P8IEQ8_ACTTE|nr:spindle and kinetochore-associated protein 1-like [Actinia tenebrosa]
MASLLEVVQHFTHKTGNLKQCMDLRNAANSSTCLSDLKSINNEVTEIEQILSKMREQLVTEKQNLDRGKALVEMVQEYRDNIKHIANNLPSHLPNTKREASNKEQSTKHSIPINQEQHSIKRAKVTSRNGDIEVPQIPYLTVDEFGTVPKYIKGRINYQQVNDAIDEINKVIKAKYKILNLPRSAMGEPIMKKYKAFKEAETEETKGHYFFIENDVKNYSNLKLDKAGRAILTIMRHCSQLKELRSGGLIRYAIKQ